MHELDEDMNQDVKMPEKEPFDSILIIGLGLIGASLAAALRKNYPSIDVYGVDNDSRTRVVAKENGWVKRSFSPDDGELDLLIQDDIDLIIIATPVNDVDYYFTKMKDLSYNGVITDTASTKAHIITAADSIFGENPRYIPGHPMSGSEVNGIDGARSDLFDGSNWILCPNENTDPDSFTQLHELIYGLNARVVSLPREKHDQAVAIVSHVPHMVASALVQLADRHSDDSKALMRLAAGGFKDTTRIAAGSPNLWCQIAFDNQESLQNGIEEMCSILGDFSSALAEKDTEAFTDLLRSSADIRRSLPSAWVPDSSKLLEVRIPMINRTGVIAEVTTIASSVGCNIQSIEIDHLTEGNAVLSLILTDEGDIGQLSYKLIEAGYSVSFSPIEA